MLLQKFHQFYEKISKWWPAFQRIGEWIPDTIYNRDSRYQKAAADLQTEKTQHQATKSELEKLAAQLEETQKLLKTTRTDVSRANAKLANYSGIEERLATYERLAEDMREAMKDARRKIGEGTALATIYHVAGERNFGIAINKDGKIIGASKRAATKLGYRDEKALRNCSLYEIIENGTSIKEEIEKATQQATTITTIYVAVKNKTIWHRDIGQVSVRLWYALEGSSQREFVAASIIDQQIKQKVHGAEVKVRMERMKNARKNSDPTKTEPSPEQPNINEDVAFQ